MPCITFPSPIGTVLLVADRGVLTRLSILSADTPEDGPATSDDTVLNEAVEQLSQWFAASRQTFDLPLAPARTPRGADMRAAIAAIPFGETASYGEVARRIASGPRAIGQACRHNALPILIPCHRIIAARGELGFYSGGNGTETKRWLLAHEQRQSQHR